MKHLLFVLSLLSGLTSTLSAQYLQTPNGFGLDITCGFQARVPAEYEGAGPQDAMEVLEQQWQNRKPSSPASKQATYTLPLVFHIIHQNGPENISDARIIASVQNLNLAYANLGYYDQGIGATTDIDFCLAQRTPDNLATSGITRTVSSLTNHLTSNDEALKSLIRWDPLEYINVYVVQEICNSQDDCLVAGYAYLPSAHGTLLDGVVLEAEFLTENPEDAVVLIHELGHYLGLFHTFEGGCLNDDCNLNGDRVCDTPPDGTTAAAACGTSVNSCTTDTDSGLSTDLPDQVTNYMDYNYFSCQNMFSEGQVERMIFFLENTRSSLLQSPACTPPCFTPITADFTVPTGDILGGQAVTLSNNSNNASEYCWYVDDILVSTALNFDWEPTVAGTYTVSLTAKGSAGNCLPDSISREVIVTCLFSAAINLPAGVMREGQQYAITSGLMGGPAAATWLLDGQVIGMSEDLTLSAPAAGFYELCLELDNNTCILETCQRIAIGEPLCLSCPEPETCAETFQLRFQGPQAFNARDVFLSVLEDGERLYAGGAYNRDPIVVATNSSGEIRWQMGFNAGQNIGRTTRLKQLPGGDILGLARLFTNGRAGSILFRLGAETGALRWAKRISSNNQDLWLNDLSVNTAGTEATLVGSIGNQNDMFRYFGYQGVFSLADGSLVNDAQTVNNTGYSTRYQVVKIPGDGLATIGGYSASNNLVYTELNIISPTGESASRIIFINNDALLCYAATRTPNGFVFLGMPSAQITNRNFYVWETDLQGNILWSKSYLSQRTLFAAQIVSNDFGYLVHAETNGGNQLLIQLGPDGDFGYTREYTEELRTVVTPQPMLLSTNSIYLPGADPGRGQSLTKLTADGRTPGLSCTQPGSFMVDQSDFSISRSEIPLVLSSASINVEDITAYTPNLAATEDACPAEACMEICDNGIDDDQDGFTDCNDPDLADDCCCRPAATLNLGPDSTVCSGYVLRPNLAGVSYQWSDGSTNDSLVILAEETVSLSLTDECGLTLSDTITLYLRPRPEWTLGNDTTVCDNAVIPLQGPTGFTEYRWSTGERSPGITTNNFGLFWLVVTDSCGLMSTDTLNVIREENSGINLGPDQLICPGDTVRFSLSGFQNYQWTPLNGLSCTNCPEVTLQPNSSSLLGVSAEFSAGCFTFDTVRINVIDTVGSATETRLCGGDTLLIGRQIITEAGIYLVANGNERCPVTDTVRVVIQQRALGLDTLMICEGDSAFVFDRFVSAPGDYDRFYEDGTGCDSLHRIHLIVFPVNQTNTALTICAGDSVLIDGSYRFTSGSYTEIGINQDGCDSTVITELAVLDSIYTQETRFIGQGESLVALGQNITEAGTYQRSYPSASGCDSLHEVRVVQRYTNLAYVPSAFSPNLDGVNDAFRVYPSNGVERIEQLRVFSRWGQLIFEVNDVASTEDIARWDGTFRGQDMPVGVYLYTYTLRLSNGNTLSQKGDFMLLR